MTGISKYFGDLRTKFTANRKLSVFVYCIILSSFFWMLSALSKTYSDRFPVDVNYDSLSNNFILTESPLSQIEIELSGTGFSLLGEKMSFSPIELAVDLNAARPHYIDNQYYLETKKFKSSLKRKLDQGLSLSYIYPDSLYFKTEKRVSKVVDVKLNKELSFESGYFLRGEIVYKPNKVVVSGPASVIDTVEWVSTEEFTYSNLEDSLDLSLNLIAPHPKVMLNPIKVDVLIPVEKFTEKRLILPIEVINSIENIELKTFPEEVELTFLVPLSKYQYLKESLVNAKVIFNESKMELKTLNVEIEGEIQFGELVKVKPEKVEYIIKK